MCRLTQHRHHQLPHKRLEKRREGLFVVDTIKFKGLELHFGFDASGPLKMKTPD